jgi:hypothetical protein
MNPTSCFFERFSALTIAVLLSIGAVGLAVISFTVMPFVGLIFAVPVAALAFYFFRVHFNRQCQIRTES